MDRFVVMVDAGYLLHQSAEIVSERASTKRHHLEVMNPAALINLLLEKTRTALGLTTRELLRVYWYDGVMASGLSPQQRAIAELPDVHFRSGIVNAAGQQRGVDSLIVTDLIELASNGAISDAALVTGDGDFAIGIEMAQKKGVRIAVIGVEDTELGVSHRQSFEITSRADRVARLNVYDLSAVMRYVPPAAPMASSTQAGDYEYSQPASYASGLAGAVAGGAGGYGARRRRRPTRACAMSTRRWMTRAGSRSSSPSRSSSRNRPVCARKSIQPAVASTRPWTAC